ncbi:hypothetical protein RM780_18920 [Streptomyces sp. DSM 44917]|uniref:Uncharacterized protein n=1 Tax=Streptomyces boetiae TaxID=3075541 RepID=A0ABU2LBQ6_9ACTN|nr:hypothetical protein [Streptomyces sp. DSM 44917]MDT0309016.1 hypothetical protein [Streptomyces sp. DSM 44917]
MSFGYADPQVTVVTPAFDFPDAPQVAVPDLEGIVDGATDAAFDAVVELAGAALIGLGALSGALLAARAAMAGTQLLADAAVRAGQAHRVREAAQCREARLRELWQDAAFAVAGTNARLAALRARTVRLSAGGPGGSAGPGTGPGSPTPPLPGPLDPAGMRIERVHQWLAEADRAIRAAEAELARRTLTAAADRDGAESGRFPGAAETLARLRAERERALAAYAAAGTPEAADAAIPAYESTVPDAHALDAARAAAFGAGLLAGLDPAVTPEEYGRVHRAVGHAAELADREPAAARRHLEEALDAAHLANWEAADRRETAEWAARQLAVLERPLPPSASAGLADPAPEIAALRGLLAGSGPVEPRLRAEISVRVAAQEAALRRVYVLRQFTEAIAAAGPRSETPGEALPGLTVEDPAPGVRHLVWQPPGWDEDHWLRLTVDPHGAVRVRTEHRPRAAGEESREARELDLRRCREGRALLVGIARTFDRAGLALDLTYDDTRTFPGPDVTAARALHTRLSDEPAVRYRDPREPK